MTDYDPMLVELYDTDNPDGPDHTFYRAAADEIGARSVLDLGCGTGILTTSLGPDGPSSASIRRGRCSITPPGGPASLVGTLIST